MMGQILMSSEPEELHEGLKSTYEMLICAFPDKVNEEDYLPLITLLRLGGMSFRTVASVMTHMIDKDYVLIYNDVSGAEADNLAKIYDLSSIEEKLKPCAYDEWVKELDTPYTD